VAFLAQNSENVPPKALCSHNKQIGEYLSMLLEILDHGWMLVPYGLTHAYGPS